jgi:hypothetical protein
MKDGWGTKGRLKRPRCIGAEGPEPIYQSIKIPETWRDTEHKLSVSESEVCIKLVVLLRNYVTMMQVNKTLNSIHT